MPVEEHATHIDNSLCIENELENDVLSVTEQSLMPVNSVVNTSDSYVSTRAGNSSIIARTDRMRKVGDRLALGMSAADIAKDLDIDIRTASNDIAAWSILLKAPTDIEALRKSQTMKMLDIQETAYNRYINDGIPVEGRLAIDASARMGKMHGLDETQAVSAISGALAGLLASLGASDDGEE